MLRNGRSFHHAGIEKAEGLLITASGVPAETIVKAARELNPKIRIVTRTAYLKESDALEQAGANAVFSSEGREISAFDDRIPHAPAWRHRRIHRTRT